MHIELKNIKPEYMSEEEVASSDIYLKEQLVFHQGKKYLIAASSGKGKTSLLNFIYGVNKNFDGEINYITDSKHHSAFDLRLNKLSYVFQDLKLFPEISLIENILLKNKLTDHKSIEEIDLWLDRVGLLHRKDQPVKTLSLGQRQRAAILRALCQPFDFLLLDEPFSHVDEKNIDILIPLLSKEVEKQGAGIILTTLDQKHFFNYDQILNL